jgi:regulator of protease activity HflC (stomatin/prohibitin superfamily)
MLKAKRIYILDTHKGLWFEDGVCKRILPAGRYKIPRHVDFWFIQRPKIDIRQVGIRECDLTIKGQEILTADKVAIRVSIIVQFKVTDPKAAVLEVEDYRERLYSDVQLAARRSLAQTTLEEILTNRNRLSEDILRDVKELAHNYGVSISRADVKDLIFPGDVQEIMNQVLKAERLSQAQLVEARSKAEIQLLEANTNSQKSIIEAEMRAKMSEITAASDARTLQIRTEAELKAQQDKAEAESALLSKKQESAVLLQRFPELLKEQELETLRDLAKNANARIYVGFEKNNPGQLGILKE